MPRFLFPKKRTSVIFRRMWRCGSRPPRRGEISPPAERISKKSRLRLGEASLRRGEARLSWRKNLRKKYRQPRRKDFSRKWRPPRRDSSTFGARKKRFRTNLRGSKAERILGKAVRE